MKKLVKTLAEFKKSKHGLKNPEKADRNKDGELSGWEVATGKAIEKSMEDEEDVNEEIDTYELELAEELLDELVEAVGSEEEVEAAAKAAYEELKDAYESNEIEMMEEGIPENLAMSALIIKLVENGKLDPKKANDFIGDNAED
jgi:hypothetical protein